MSDIYKIGVHLGATSNLGALLSGLATQLTGVHRKVGEVEKSFLGLNRAKLAFFGGASIVAGAGILGGLKAVAGYGVDILDQQSRMIRAGRTQGDVMRVTADAYARVAKLVPTATAADGLRVINQLAVVMGSLKDAEDAAPIALKIEGLLANVTGKSAEGSGHMLYRALEMKGGTAGDAASKAIGQKLLETFVQDIAASGGKLTASDYQQLGRFGGAYWKKTTPEFAAGPLSVMAADMGGMAAGTTLATFGQFLSGATQMSKQQFETLGKLDMLDMSKVHKQKNGGYNTDAGAIHGSLQYAGDYFGFVQKVLLPAFASHGIKEGPERDSMMGKIGRNRNTLRMLTMFSDPEFVAQITKDIEVFRKALGLDKAYDDFAKNDPKGVEEGFHKQFDSMMGAIGAPMMQAALPVMRQVTSMFTDIGVWANAHPDTMKDLGQGLALLGGAFITAGGIAMLAALGTGGALVLGIGALAAAFKTFAPKQFDEWLAGFLKIGDGIIHFDWKTIVDGLGMELSATFGLLPDRVKGAIEDAIKKIGSFFTGALDYLNPFHRTAFLSGANGSGGFINASYGAGGAGGYGGGGGATADSIMARAGGDGFNTRGVRNMNPGNVAYGPWARAHGATGAAGTDTGHGVAVFPSFEAGYAAMASLAGSKYRGGRRSIDSLIAGPNGWTPGNHAAAANVARMMGISPFDDAHLDSPGAMDAFKSALSVQELGPAGARFAKGHIAPARRAPIVIHQTIQLDGQTIAKNTTKHQVRMTYMPNAIGTHDNFGSYFPLGGTMVPT